MRHAGLILGALLFAVPAASEERAAAVAVSACGSMAACKHECAEGKPASCVRVGLALQYDMWEDNYRPDVLSHYGVACESGMAAGCRRAAESLVYEPKKAELVDFASKACKLGDGVGCVLALIFAETQVDDCAERFAAASALLEAACDAGSAGDCVIRGLPIGGTTSADGAAWWRKAVDNIEVLCGTEDVLGCFVEVRCLQVWDDQFSLLDQGAYARIAGWLRRVCRGGSAGGCRQAFTLSVRSDTATAVDLARRGCELGDHGLCEFAASELEQGVGVARDMPAAAALRERACAVRFGDACTDLAIQLARGDGIQRDAARAAALHRRECEGNSESCLELAIATARGDGVSRDPKSARQLFVRASEDGDLVGHVVSVLTDGVRVPRDAKTAAKILARACDDLFPEHCVSLGTLYENGDGVNKDPNRAKALYGRGCRPKTKDVDDPARCGCSFATNLAGGVANSVTVLTSCEVL